MTKVQTSLKSASDAKEDGFSRGVTTFMVDPRIIEIEEGFNARPIDPDHVEYLAQLMRDGIDTGYLLLQMVDGKPTLRDGHHRHQAYLMLIAEGVDVLKVKALEFKGDEKKAIFAMLATQSGKQYTTLQQGGEYVKLMNIFGMSYAEIAKERGMSVQHVKDAIQLTEQSHEMKELITTGQVSSSTALKLVKKEGAKEAVKTLREARVIAPGKPLTQKVIDNLAKNAVPEVKKRAQIAGEHIAAMLDSPNFDKHTRSVLSDTLALVTGRTKSIPIPRQDEKGALEIIRTWLRDAAEDSKHTGVRTAANLLMLAANGNPLPIEGSPSAQHYGHMLWLQELAAKSTDEKYRTAAHWFMAVLSAHRTKQEIAPAPSVMSLEEAMQAERDSDGAVMAETLCPEHAELITWMRGRG